MDSSELLSPDCWFRRGDHLDEARKSGAVGAPVLSAPGVLLWWIMSTKTIFHEWNIIILKKKWFSWPRLHVFVVLALAPVSGPSTEVSVSWTKDRPVARAEDEIWENSQNWIFKVTAGAIRRLIMLLWWVKKIKYSCIFKFSWNFRVFSQNYVILWTALPS